MKKQLLERLKEAEEFYNDVKGLNKHWEHIRKTGAGKKHYDALLRLARLQYKELSEYSEKYL